MFVVGIELGEKVNMFLLRVRFVQNASAPTRADE